MKMGETYAKGPSGHTKCTVAAGCKQLGEQFMRPGQPTTLSWAPPDRVYTRDYRVPDEDDSTNRDTVSPFVGNPLIF